MARKLHAHEIEIDPDGVYLPDEFITQMMLLEAARPFDRDMHALFAEWGSLLVQADPDDLVVFKFDEQEEAYFPTIIIPPNVEEFN